MDVQFGYAAEMERINVQSAYAGKISKLIMIYTQTAEVSVSSLFDILKALPDADITIINQFAPDSKEFGLLVSNLNRDGKGFNSKQQPRLRFIQDARSFGPWPRDQVLVDDADKLWVSAAEQHQLRDTFLHIAEVDDIQSLPAPFSFIGANILASNKGLLQVRHNHLTTYLKGSVLELPAPTDVPFHLDLLVMPLSDNLIAVGDVALAREHLSRLTPKEVRKIILRWMTEYAAAACNVEINWREQQVITKKNDRPGLMLWQMLEEKLAILKKLLAPGAFSLAVKNEPSYLWDDRIANTLSEFGYNVVRIPFWPGNYGRETGKKSAGLPMICYPNCLVWDDGILMPTYGIEALDNLAIKLLEQACGKPVHPVSGGAILGYGSSGPHCLTVEFRD